jgi:hypothetical protein
MAIIRCRWDFGQSMHDPEPKRPKVSPIPHDQWRAAAILMRAAGGDIEQAVALLRQLAPTDETLT